MTYDYFFTFFFPILVVFAALLSLIPAYIALRRGKIFWVWWLGTASVFGILLFILVKAQAISLIIYLLTILPVASILALFPKMRMPAVPTPLIRILNIGSKLKRNKKVSVFATILFAGAILYYSLIFLNRDSLDRIYKVYFITSALIILIACLGLSHFVAIVSEKTTRQIVTSTLLTLLLASPIFLRPSRAYDIGFSFGRIISNGIYIGPVITDLIYGNPVAGIFVLLGICSGCLAIFIKLNDRYRLINTLFSHQNLPLLRLSKNRYLSSFILAGILLLYFLPALLFKNDNLMSLFDGFGTLGFFIWIIFFWVVVPWSLVVVIGVILIFSTTVIVLSIGQSKVLAATAVFVTGILSIYAMGHSSDPPWIFGSYSFGSGFAALVLWVLSDYFLPRSNQNEKTYDIL